MPARGLARSVDAAGAHDFVLRRLVPFAADFPHFSDAPFGPDDNKVLRDLFVDLGGLPFTRILAGQQ